MTPEERDQLEMLTSVVSGAVTLVKSERVALEAFLARTPDPDDSAANAASAIVRPIFEAAKNLVETHERQIRQSRLALDLVNGR